MSVKSTEDLRVVAELIKSLPEVLAVEYLDKRKIFGDKATIEEM
mgnify:CR=1 FL=1